MCMNNDEEKIDIQPVPSLDEVDEVVNNLPTMPIIHTDTEVEEEDKKDESVFELPEMPSSPIEIAPVPKLEFEEEEVGSPKFNIPESQLNNVVEEEKNDAGAYESILEEAVTVLPERSLRWHYRSRDEHLIAFSNIKIYHLFFYFFSCHKTICSNSIFFALFRNIFCFLQRTLSTAVN